uniref:Uncharacterized protein LOC111101643 isoform X2 n=2 Tax=Crassostrea virginica TaxID=6565 RepID=A0A8B8AEK6_CRAVI|nr:uncharacterized protein LOC111101643 isoform X2 [Crassostrea virginica]
MMFNSPWDYIRRLVLPSCVKFDRGGEESKPKMPFEKKCSVKIHQTICKNSDSSTIFRVDGKKVRASVIERLKSEGHLSDKAKYICEECVKYTEARIPVKRKKPTIVGEIIDRIESGEIEDADLEMIMTAIGRSQSSKIYADSVVAGGLYKSDEILRHFDPSSYLKDRNGPLLAFFKGVMGESYQTANAVILSNAVESVYFLCNKNFIGPLAFAKSLLIYSKTGSKEGTCIATASSPSGSYTTILGWLKAHSQDRIKIPESSDVISFFDNNQVIGRKWRVKNDFKAESSVITSVAHIESRSNIQTDGDVAPSKWQFFSPASKKEAISKIRNKELEYQKEFNTLRHGFIQQRLQKVYEQQVACEDGLKDHIDNDTNPPREIDPPSERYTFIPSHHEKEPRRVISGEPVFENPCSYEAVEKVLDHLLEEAGVGSTRQWTTVGCDGLPYILASRIIEEIFICPVCRRQYDQDDFGDHIKTTEHCVDIEDGRKYRNILMLTGHGHFEINMTKALFKLLWELCLVDLAKMLGFKSPKALASCQSAHALPFMYFEPASDVTTVR